MPAGARSTYLGIHGGTVPVSLLVSRDGQDGSKPAIQMLPTCCHA